ncbi:hypothetical protein [Sphingomonas rubra]|uniref:hypothetical protein n=1 Tax=Sphingomonas rubra TaxID=634430 RepID=UPI0011605BC8|nr:hypothetical protein [Sphingomonas rubra]
MRDYVMAIDVSDMPIQAQEMIHAMGQHMATMPKARALAIVTGKSLAHADPTLVQAAVRSHHRDRR